MTLSCLHFLEKTNFKFTVPIGIQNSHPSHKNMDYMSYKYDYSHKNVDKYGDR